MEWQRGPYTISTDRVRVNDAAVHAFLSGSYWAAGIPLEILRRALDSSLCFGLYQGERQIGFARVITDYATFGYVGDVYVLEEFRGQGLAAWLMEVVHAHPELQGFRRWVLLTRDAHTLYEKSGYRPLAKPDRYMERWSPDVYRKPDAAT